MTRWVRLWGPVWAMMALIFVLSSMSELPPAPGDVDDSVAHALEYGVLAVLLVRGLIGALWRGISIWAAWIAVLLATLYGVTDEVHQRFVPGRTAEVTDLIADALGATVAVGLIWAWQFVVNAQRRTVSRLFDKAPGPG